MSSAIHKNELDKEAEENRKIGEDDDGEICLRFLIFRN